MTTLETLDDLYSDDPLDAACAAQALINSGDAWRLEGSIGRACMAKITAGHCACGTEDRRDYYGNLVPSRTRLQSGTKGTIGFVAARRGQEWADAIAAVA